jgi:type I restriction enzyme, R subunit
MTSNFHHITLSPYKKLAATLQEAERHTFTAPAYTAVLCRKSLEEWIRWLYENDADLEEPYDTSLNSLLHNQDLRDLLAPSLFKQVNLVRKLGNDAVHASSRIHPEEALHVLNIMHGFTSWVMRVYSEERINVPAFDASIIPQETPAVKYKDRIAELEEQFHHAQKLLREKEEELQRIQLIKDQHGRIPPPPDPNEAVTREIYINLLLQEAGWDPKGANVAEYPVTGMPTGDGKNDGPGFVDYVLWGDDGKPLAVVEAKRTSRDPRVGANQAKLYADCLERLHGQRPIIFYSNGFETYIWDDTWYAAREIYGFYKKEELELMIQRRSTRTSLIQAPVDAAIADRYYQIEAIRSIGRVLESRGRDSLLVMATGTGKTRTAAALVDVLSKCNWAKRVLFLADRNQLIRQARKNFTTLLPNLPNFNLCDRKNDIDKSAARIIFSTYQTMINLIDKEYNNEERYYGVGHFDLIIFDEIHRSVYNKYKAIFQYFDGYRVGLTATPKAEGDRDTYHLFGLEPNMPTYAYELEQGVEDKYLVPPYSVSVPVKFHREGIKYADLSREEQLNYEQMFADPITGEYPDEINNTALNTWLFNENTTDEVLAYLMKKGIKVSGGDRLGKTIIFARSHIHAEFIKERFDKQFPYLGGHFCKVIDNQVEYPHTIIDQFSLKDATPHIAISVDMLDTGIDIPECVNLVFYKPIRSSAKFWQMIGRGTRLCKDLFGPAEDKENFIIFDFCENFEFFGKKPQGLDDKKGRSLTERLFQQRLKLVHLLQKKGDAGSLTYAEELKVFMHDQVNRLKEESFLVRQHWRVVEKYRDLYRWNALSELEVKEIMDHLAALVYEKDDDEQAKRFDQLCYNLELDYLQKGSVGQQWMDETITLAAALSKRGAIPMVAAKMSLIKEVQAAVYWQDPSIERFEHLRKELRHLIRFIEKDRGTIYFSTFSDQLMEDPGDPKPVIITTNLEGYKKRVTEYIQKNRNHITIHKLRTNQAISASELKELEKMLFEQGDLGTHEQFVKAYGEQPLGSFIRSIVGLDLSAANAAFGSFVNNPTLNAAQIRFVNMIIQYLSTNGVITTDKLFEPPFTEINSNGLLGVFGQTQAQEVVQLINEVNQKAMVG